MGLCPLKSQRPKGLSDMSTFLSSDLSPSLERGRKVSPPSPRGTWSSLTGGGPSRTPTVKVVPGARRPQGVPRPPTVPQSGAREDLLREGRRPRGASAAVRVAKAPLGGPPEGTQVGPLGRRGWPGRFLLVRTSTHCPPDPYRLRVGSRPKKDRGVPARPTSPRSGSDHGARGRDVDVIARRPSHTRVIGRRDTQEGADG